MSHIWSTLTWETLPAWIDSRTTGPLPPLYCLASPGRVARGASRVAIDSRQLNVRPDSGIAEFQIPGTAAPPTAQRPLSALPDALRSALDFAQRTDGGRELSEPEPSDGESPYWEYRTSIPEVVTLDGSSMPVVGPGGKVTVATIFDRGEPGTLVSVVIRPREQIIKSSRWRPMDRILAAARCASPGESPLIRIDATFGMFELSKFEPQELMRPVFIFALIGLDPEDMREAWLYTIVEAATEADDVLSTAGLGRWITE